MKPYKIEKAVRGKLGEMFGSELRKRKLVIGYDSKKRPQIHEFDLTSDDMNIIGEIKAGKCCRRNYNLALVDCVYLDRVRAQTKIIVFTDKELYGYFKGNSEGVVSKDIQAILITPSAYVKAVAPA
jgi:hypothetical protein